MIKDQQIDFKGNAKVFVRTYSYLSRIIDFKNLYWEMLWLLLKHLIPHLKIEEETVEENILEVIDMDSYRTSRIADKVSIAMEDQEGFVDPIPVQIGGGRPATEFDTLENIVESFNRRFGDIDWGQGVDANEAEKVLTKDIPERLENDTSGLLSILNSDKANAREESNNLVKAIMQGMMFTNTSIYKKYADDDAFRSRYQEFIFDIIWSNAQRQGRK